MLILDKDLTKYNPEGAEKNCCCNSSQKQEDELKLQDWRSRHDRTV